MKEEMILVVRRALFDSLGSFQGFSSNVDHYLPSLLDRENNFFAARSSAETDPSLKQIIPYALIAARGQILRYRRGKSSGEQRLVAKYSIGIGGHMNDQDEGLFALDHQAYLAGVQREIDEEVQISAPRSHRIVGLINDDSTEVGQVHLGVVHVLELDAPEAVKRESAITQVEFLPPGQLSAERDLLEGWSQICLDHLTEILGGSSTRSSSR
jgi:predicted NUDIX family phosphoesterase